MMRRTLSRRGALRLGLVGGAGLLGLALSACSSSSSNTPAATSAPGQTSTAAWDQLVAAAQKEGTVVVSGPPAPDARTKLPAAFKQRFNIDVDYLAGNSSQLASRIESERAASQLVMRG